MGRAARVVESVLRATAEELSRSGYASLRVEEVASIAGVNKTTIYRRWPTKADLVAAALRFAKPPLSVETGALRTDILAWLRDALAFASTPLGRGIIRVIQAERGHPELAKISRTLRREQRAARLGLVERAIERGELPHGTDPEVFTDLCFLPVTTRCIAYGERLAPNYIERTLDIVLRGVGATLAPRRAARGANAQRDRLAVRKGAPSAGRRVSRA